MPKVSQPLNGLLGNQKYTARFLKKVQKTASCWFWSGGATRNVNGDKRAAMRGPGGCRSASRLSYALFKGDIAAGELVLHSCDNGMCVNPDHLRIGTHEENTQAMISRGRSKLGAYHAPRARGYKRPFMNRVSKLTDDDVRAIRKDERDPWHVALDYDVSAQTVYAVKRRTRKGHVPDEVPPEDGG